MPYAAGKPSETGVSAPVSEDDESTLMDEQLMLMLDRQKEVRPHEKLSTDFRWTAELHREC